jgi:uncharacterized membrane protein YeaQ/YmgE (transglycosylase-associated protein family)
VQRSGETYSGTIYAMMLKTHHMSLLGFLVLLIIAAVCGGIGQSLAGYSLGGCFVSIIVGLIGAYLGIWIARELGLPEHFTVNIDGQPFPIVWAIIGSAVFTLIMALLRRAFVGRRGW